MSPKHPGSRRTRSSKSSEPDDLFIAKLFEAGKWAQQNQQILVIAGVVAAVLVLGMVYYANLEYRF